MIDTQKRVVVPPEVLAALDAKPGDYVAFRIEGKNVSVHKARWSIDR